MRLLLVAVLALALLPSATQAMPAIKNPAPPRMVRDRPSQDPYSAGGYLPGVHSLWTGDQYTLPFNDSSKSWQDMVGIALRMQAVQSAMQRMQSRGYIRRADKDTAFMDIGVTTVVISYELAGTPIAARQPVVIAKTQGLRMDPNGWIPISVIGGVVASMDSTELVSERPGEEPFTVMWSRTPVNGGMGTEADVDWRNIFLGLCSGSWGPTMVGAVNTWESMTIAEKQWWKGMAVQSYFGAVAGGLGGIVIGQKFTTAGAFLGWALGAGTGASAAAAKWVQEHPYPQQP